MRAMLRPSANDQRQVKIIEAQTHALCINSYYPGYIESKE